VLNFRSPFVRVFFLVFLCFVSWSFFRTRVCYIIARILCFSDRDVCYGMFVTGCCYEILYWDNFALINIYKMINMHVYGFGLFLDLSFDKNNNNKNNKRK